MNKKVIEFVRKYAEEHLDKSDPKQVFDVFLQQRMAFLLRMPLLMSMTTASSQSLPTDPLPTQRSVGRKC